MSTPTYPNGSPAATAGESRFQREGERGLWQERTRVVLQPIAFPSILGLYGFAAATFIVSSNLAWGPYTKDWYLAPFAAMFGGVAQFLAGMWSYKARDGVGTAMHGMWGSFWMAYGILWLLIGTGALKEPSGAFQGFGIWFTTLALITAAGALAAWKESLGLFAVLATLAAGSGILAGALLSGGEPGVESAAGWVLIASAAFAFYTATAMMVEGTWGRVLLPLGKVKKDGSPAPHLKGDANKPGAEAPLEPVQWELAEPGIRKGQ